MSADLNVCLSLVFTLCFKDLFSYNIHTAIYLNAYYLSFYNALIFRWNSGGILSMPLLNISDFIHFKL